MAKFTRTMPSRGLFLVIISNPVGSNLSLPPFSFPLRHILNVSVQVSVLEMDGQFDKLEELIYVESHLSNTSTKFYGEITQQMLKNADFPGSNNGTGLFQTMVGLKLREAYERIIAKRAATVAA